MSIKLEQYVSNWKVYNSESTSFIPLWKYIAIHSTREEIHDMFCELRDKMTNRPCCMRHTGNLPTSVNMMENTPFTGGDKCNQTHRAFMRFLRQAFIHLSTEHGTIHTFVEIEG
jgi:hypothetical protein